MIIIAVASLVMLAVAATVSRITHSPIAALALAITSGIWLVVNKQLEGPVLITVTPSHGLTVGDLFGFAGFFYSLRILWARYSTSIRARSRMWMLMGLCTAIFVAGPIAKLILLPTHQYGPWVHHFHS